MTEEAHPGIELRIRLASGFELCRLANSDELHARAAGSRDRDGWHNLLGFGRLWAAPKGPVHKSPISEVVVEYRAVTLVPPSED